MSEKPDEGRPQCLVLMPFRVLLRTIYDADIVLCDVSSHSPNVFLELGWAVGADKPFVVIRDGARGRRETHGRKSDGVPRGGQKTPSTMKDAGCAEWLPTKKYVSRFGAQSSPRNFARILSLMSAGEDVGERTLR